MKLTSALLAVLLTAAPVMTHSAEVNPAEPPATPAGGGLLAGFGIGDVVNIVIPVVLFAAIVSGGDENTETATSTTGTGTGTGTGTN